MGFIAKDSGGGNFRPVPPGSYIARCYQVIDLGTQTEEGKFGVKSAHKIRLSWEVHGEDDDGKPLTITVDGRSVPMTVSKNYTVSLHEKAALRRELVAWRGRDFTPEEARAFDVSKLLGAWCLINVTNTTGNNGKTYANVAGLSPLPKALAASKPPGVHELVCFNLDDPDMGVFDSLPPWLQDLISKAPEFKTSPSTVAATTADDDGDVPF